MGAGAMDPMQVSDDGVLAGHALTIITYLRHNALFCFYFCLNFRRVFFLIYIYLQMLQQPGFRDMYASMMRQMADNPEMFRQVRQRRLNGRQNAFCLFTAFRDEVELTTRSDDADEPSHSRYDAGQPDDGADDVEPGTSRLRLTVFLQHF